MPHTYQYPRAALTVDCVIFGLDAKELKVLLIERGLEPFKGKWALPGGFVHVDETLDDAAARELWEETGVQQIFLEQLHTFGGTNRDPRERVVSVAYYALVKLASHEAKADSDAAAAQWFPVSQIPQLAFDHADVFATAMDRLKRKVRHQPIGYELLPSEFSLLELKHLYEAVLGNEFDAGHFHQKVRSFGLIEPVQENGASNPDYAAALFRFHADNYKKLKATGLYFDL